MGAPWLQLMVRRRDAGPELGENKQTACRGLLCVA